MSMFIIFTTSKHSENPERKFTDTYIFITNSWKKMNIKNIKVVMYFSIKRKTHTTCCLI